MFELIPFDRHIRSAANFDPFRMFDEMDRRFFNSATKELNSGVQRFPAVLFAGMFGFHQEPMFEIPQEERATVQKAPEVKF